MCYTGKCKWEHREGPDAGDCSWPGWGADGHGDPPCPPGEIEMSEPTASVDLRIYRGAALGVHEMPETETIDK